MDETKKTTVSGDGLSIMTKYMRINSLSFPDDGGIIVGYCGDGGDLLCNFDRAQNVAADFWAFLGGAIRLIDDGINVFTR